MERDRPPVARSMSMRDADRRQLAEDVPAVGGGVGQRSKSMVGSGLVGRRSPAQSAAKSPERRPQRDGSPSSLQPQSSGDVGRRKTMQQVDAMIDLEGSTRRKSAASPQDPSVGGQLQRQRSMASPTAELRQRQSASPALGLERSRSFASSPSMGGGRGGGSDGGGSDTPQQFTLKRTMTRVNMGAMPSEAPSDTASVRSGVTTAGGLFAHELGTKITRAVIKPKLMIGEEDRVMADMIKCCALMEGRWSVTAHASSNGTAQSILQTSLDALRKPDAWQSWWSTLNEGAKAFEDLATRLYAESCAGGAGEFDQDPMQPVGTSCLHERTQTMLHLWHSPECAKMFTRLLIRVWQTLFEHRIEGIFAPYSVLFCIEGRYVSVIALPPLLPRQQPPIPVPGRDGPSSAASSLISAAAEQLLHALHCPPDVTNLVVAPGFDGRHYIVSLRELLARRLPPPFELQLIRPEALLSCMRDNALTQADRFVLRTSVPNAVEDLAKTLLKRRQEDRSISELTKEGILRMVLHSNGVNVSLLHHVLLCAQHRFLETQEAAYRLIIDLSNTEMVGRVLKQFIRVDMMYQNNEGRFTLDDRLDVVNRFAGLLISKDVPFWLDYVLPALRIKFHAPETFELSHDQVHIPTVLRIASSRIGCEYSTSAQRFDKFAVISGMWLGCCRAPDWVAPDVPRTAEQVKELVIGLWKESDAIESVKMKRAFKARAMVASVMLNTGTSFAKDEFDRISQFSETQGSTMESRIEDIRLASIMLDLRMEVDEKRKLAEKYVRKVSKFPSGNFAVDGPLITLKYLQAVTALKMIGDVPPVELIEAALRQFDSIPNTNFPFSVVHAQSLVTAEQAVPGLSEKSITVFHSIVNEAKRVISEKHGGQQLAKYLHRAMWAMVDSPIAEGHEGSALLAAEAFRAHVAAYSIEDNRTAQLAYLTALFLARHCSKRIPEAGPLRDSLRKIADSMRSVAAANQIAISRAGISMTILQRAEAIMRRLPVSVAAGSPTAAEPFMAPAGAAIMDFLKRFGTPLFASLFIQRVGRGFDDRRWMDWLRRDTKAAVLQRVARGFLHRRFRMFSLYKKKISKLRTVLVHFVQRMGRGMLLRKDMHRLHVVRKVMAGALTRVRLNRRKWAIRRIEAIGRGYMGRLLVAAPYQEEMLRRLEMERQRRLQEERDRLSAAAERCRQRMLEVQRKLLDAAWDRIRLCITDETQHREKVAADAAKDFQALARLSQRDRVHREEIAARRRDVLVVEAQARAEEDRLAALELRKPDMLRQRRALWVQQTPLNSLQETMRTATSGSDSSAPIAMGRPSPWESGARGLASLSAAPALSRLQFDQLHHRKLIHRQYMDGLEVLVMWGMYCRIRLSRHAQTVKTSLLAELQRRTFANIYSAESVETERQIMLHRAATRIQCAWRCNVARFELRYRLLHREVQRRHVFAKYYDERLPLTVGRTYYERMKDE